MSDQEVPDTPSDNDLVTVVSVFIPSVCFAIVCLIQSWDIVKLLWSQGPLLFIFILSNTFIRMALKSAVWILDYCKDTES